MYECLKMICRRSISNTCKVLCSGVFVFVLFYLWIIKIYQDSSNNNKKPNVTVQMQNDTLIQASEEETTEEEYEEEISLWDEFSHLDVKMNKDIFFIESSGVGTLSPRQGCVIEAAASANKYRTVWVLISGANHTSIDVFQHKVTKPLLKYQNIRLRYFTISKMLSKTKLWNWFLHSDWQHSPDRNDLLWLALSFIQIYKHGGTILAWDSLSLGPVLPPSEEQSQSLALCNGDDLALNILNFPVKHPLIENILDRAEKTPILTNFDKNSLIQETLIFCKVKTVTDLEYKQCKTFSPILPESFACPIERSRYWTIFDDKRAKIAAKQVQKKETKIVNLWLNDSENLSIWASESFKSFIFYLSQKHCPLTFTEQIVL